MTDPDRPRDDAEALAVVRQRLADSQASWRQLFKASPLPMWVQAVDTGRIVAVNHAALALYGHTRAQFLGLSLGDLDAGLDAGLAVGLAGGRRHRTRDGRLIDVELLFNQIEFDGHAVRLVVAIDTTAQHQAEAARRSAADRFEKLFLAAPEPISLSELDSGRFLQVNAAFCKLFGHPADRVIGRTSAELGLWSQRAGRDSVVARLRAGEAVRDFEGVAYHRSGAAIDVLFSAEKVELDGRDCLLLAFRDITQRQRDLAALRHSELRFRLAAAGGQVWEWDFGAGGVLPSQAFFAQLGYPAVAPQQVAALFESIVPADDLAQLKRHLVRHLQRRSPYRVQFRARDAQDRLRWFETQGQAVWDSSGHGTYMAGTTFEVTERRHAEQALMDSQDELFALAQQLLHQERETHRRLAQSLHDRLGQSLASARLHLDLVREGLGVPAAAVALPLERLSTLIGQAIGEVRSTLTALRPPLLEVQGLAASLRSELADHPGRGCGVALSLVVAPGAELQRWPDDVEHAAFMVAREAVANALLHARSTRVDVRLAGGAGDLWLEVADDGVGMAADLQQGHPGHLGLVGMRERALGIGARLVVAPGDSAGTRITLRWQQDAPLAPPDPRHPPGARVEPPLLDR